MLHFLKVHFQKRNRMFDMLCLENKAIKHAIAESFSVEEQSIRAAVA